MTVPVINFQHKQTKPLVGEEDEHLTTVSIKIMARMPRMGHSRMVVISKQVFIANFSFISYFLSLFVLSPMLDMTS